MSYRPGQYPGYSRPSALLSRGAGGLRAIGRFLRDLVLDPCATVLVIILALVALASRPDGGDGDMS